MFYIRTADRLQRTAAWLEALEGGLDHLREVVVDDALGLGAELEAAMARHVDTYADEWRAVLDDPDKLARFVSFVNAPEDARPDDLVRHRARPGRCRGADEPVVGADRHPVGARRGAGGAETTRYRGRGPRCARS